MSTLASIAHVVLALLLAPLLPGVINRVKAWFAGRRGPPLLQAYYDLWKLLHKGAVYSKTTTWVFVAGPIVGLACVATALLIVPLGGVPGLLAFSGDFLLLAYLLGLMRFFTILAALDTGSSFEGMGASREAFYSALAEPALLLGLAAMAAQSHSLSLSAMYAAVTSDAMTSFAGPGVVAGGRGPADRVPRRERPHSHRRPQHAPGTDDDPRSHGAWTTAGPTSP